MIRDNQTAPGPVCTCLQAAVVDCSITERGKSLQAERSGPLSVCGCGGTGGGVEPGPRQPGAAPGPQRKSPGEGCSPAWN